MNTLPARFAALVSLMTLISLFALTSARAPAVSTNHELLTSLGMVKRRVSPNHHRKRLATESRSSYNSDDSHMFIIKLPPNPYYYSHLKPVKPDKTANDINKVPVSFKSNGKPARVYHWNIPVLKKFAHARHGGANSRLSTGDSKLYNIQKTLPWAGSVENDVHEDLKAGKPYLKTRKSQNAKPKLSYYAPAAPRKTLFHKYFSGNGKPQSFYVIEKTKKPIYYHRLLP